MAIGLTSRDRLARFRKTGKFILTHRTEQMHLATEVSGLKIRIFGLSYFSK